MYQFIRKICISSCLRSVNTPIPVFGVEGRYVRALYSAAHELKQLDEVEKHLSQFLQELNSKPSMQDFVNAVDVPRVLKVEALVEAGEKTGMPKAATNFLAVVAENGRLKNLRKMITMFQAVMVAHRNEMPCEVITAQSLDDEQRKALLQALEAHAKGKKIQLSEKVNTDIMGGMIVAIDDKVVDMSTSRKMNMYISILKQNV